MANKIKGDLYELFVLNTLSNDFDSVYFFQDTPEYIIAKTNLRSKYDIYLKYKNCDIGADLVAIKDNQVYFIQCKNYSGTISINDLSSFYFLLHEFNLNGMVYYNGTLSDRLIDLSNNIVKFVNLPFNNTIIDVEIIPNNVVCSIQPRDYQIDIYNQFININRGIIALPCGMGKTFTSWLIGKDFNNIIIISPTRNLADSNLIQLTYYSNSTYNPILISMDGTRNIDLINSSIKDKNIISSTFDSVDILNMIIGSLNNFIIFVDEFHNLTNSNLSNPTNEIFKLLNSNYKIIFLSATPFANYNNFSHIFGNHIFKYSWKNAIQNKFICDLKLILPHNFNDTLIFQTFLNDIKFNIDDREITIKSFFILKGISYFGNKKTILYATTTQEALLYFNTINWLQNLLNIQVQSNIIDYTTTKINRIKYIKQFKSSDINQFLINVQILNEGIDIPECDSIFITKPNDNTTNLIQRICRSNRILPNKNICWIYLWNIKTQLLNYISNLCNLNNSIEHFDLIPFSNKLLNSNNSNISQIKKNNIQYMDLINFSKDFLLCTNDPNDFITFKRIKHFYKLSNKYKFTRWTDFKKLFEDTFKCSFIDRKTIKNVDYRTVLIGWKFSNT